LVRRVAAHFARAGSEAVRRLCIGRGARRPGLVHGAKRSHRRSARLAVSLERAPGLGVGDPRRHAMDSDDAPHAATCCARHARAVVTLLLWWLLRVTPRLPPRAEVGGNALLAMLVLQIALGIATLLYVVPLPLAALHQAGALLTFALALNVAHALR